MPELVALRRVTVPVGDVRNKVIQRGEKHNFTDEQAKRLLALGRAEKPRSKKE